MKKTVSQQKEEQGFQKKAPCCASCMFFEFDKKEEKARFGTYVREFNLRCTYGSFAVKKSNWCGMYEPKQEE